jgi:hypothetical protein
LTRKKKKNCKRKYLLNTKRWENLKNVHDGKDKAGK